MQGGRIAVHDIQSSGHCGNFLHLLPRDIFRIGDNFQFLQRLRKARVGQGESSYTTAAVANRQRCFMGSSESVDLTPPEFRVGDFRFPRVPNYISLSFVLHFLALFESEILQFRKNVLI